MDYSSKLKELLDLTVKEQASDLHFSVSHPPLLRISGKLVPLVKFADLKSEDCQGLAFVLMSEEQKTRFSQDKDIDFSYNFEGRARFRVNIFTQLGDLSVAMRLVPAKIKTIDELNLPQTIHQFTVPSQGFVLVTGSSKVTMFLPSLFKSLKRV